MSIRELPLSIRLAVVFASFFSLFNLIRLFGGSICFCNAIERASSFFGGIKAICIAMSILYVIFFCFCYLNGFLFFSSRQVKTAPSTHGHVSKSRTQHTKIHIPRINKNRTKSKRSVGAAIQIQMNVICNMDESKRTREKTAAPECKRVELR